ncbi:MAG: TrkA family potassium uptake protein [Cytophagales bacterium]|nr:MAG: TrkA family potassium uptake protein [Cytophagales bacterium]
MKRFAIIGLGQFGKSVAIRLAQRGVEVLALDSDINKIEDIKEEVAHAVEINATDLKALKAQNIAEMDAVVVAIGENFEALMLTVSHLMELKVPRIIAKAATQQQRQILEKMGVEEILSPEEEIGKGVAEKLLNASIRSYLPLPDDYEIVEIEAPKKITKKSIKEIDFRYKYQLTLITIRRFIEEEVEGNKQKYEHLLSILNAETRIEPHDILIVLGKTEDVDRFINLNI